MSVRFISQSGVSDALHSSCQPHSYTSSSRASPEACDLVGGDSLKDPPVPIPNTEVKLQGADGTAGETRWESRSPPATPSSSRGAPPVEHRSGGCLRCWGLRESGGPAALWSARVQHHATILTRCPSRSSRGAGRRRPNTVQAMAVLHSQRPPIPRQNPPAWVSCRLHAGYAVLLVVSAMPRVVVAQV